MHTGFGHVHFLKLELRFYWTLNELVADEFGANGLLDICQRRGNNLSMTNRPRHPKPPIENAVQYAEQLGWRVVMSNGHAWGRLFCPFSSRGGCIVSVWSTPKVPENHARHIRKAVDSCPHRVTDEPVVVKESDL